MCKRVFLLGFLAVVPALAGCVHKQLAEMEQAASARSVLFGAVAPDFALPDHNGNTVRLDDYAGQWVVLYFYPKDETPGCTCQATEFTDQFLQFRRVGATIVGISPDQPVDHAAFIVRHDLDVTLLSDTNTEVMRTYGAAADIGGGPLKRNVVLRQTFLIGPDGYIRYHWPVVYPPGHAERVVQTLERLKRTPPSQKTRR